MAVCNSSGDIVDSAEAFAARTAAATVADTSGCAAKADRISPGWMTQTAPAETVQARSRSRVARITDRW
jgi:hypothetical protein